MKLKPPVRIAASEYESVVALWRAAGLPIKPSGRDSRQAFERQLAGGAQTALGVKTETGERVGVALATHDSRRGGVHYMSKRSWDDA